MVAAKHRITKEKDFKKIFRTGEGASGTHFHVKVADSELGHPRFAVVISKKVSKLSTRRNADRRRLAEAAAESIDSWRDMDVIFYVKQSLKETSFGQIKNELTEVLKKAGVL